MKWSTPLIIGTVLVCTAYPAFAQTDASPRHGPLVTTRDVGILSAALAGSAVLFSVDRSIADQVRGSSLQQNAFARNVMSGARVFGDPGVVVISAGLWAAGQFGGDRTQWLVELRSLEAMVVSGAITSIIKAATGRAMPSRSPGNAHDFVLARGIGEGSDVQSFPSGHTTAAFATAVDAEWGRLSPSAPDGWGLRCTAWPR